MPFIDVKTTASVSDDKCEALKTEIGKAISLIPGKSEGWLMVEIEPDKKIWFRGDDAGDSAMVTVAVFGSVSDRDAEKLTDRITEILSSQLGIAPDRIYVSYSEHDKWGWNGSNF